MTPSRLEIAVRALIQRAEQKKKPSSWWNSNQVKWPHSVLVIDTETTTDERQKLLFGSARYFHWHHGQLVGSTELLFYPDDLPNDDPAGFAILRDYARAGRPIKLLTLSDFLKDWLWPAVHGATHIIAYNVPFDLSRLALGWGRGRGKAFRKGFSLRMWELLGEKGKENRRRPRIRIRHIDAKRALINLSQVGDPELQCDAQFLDLKTLVFALTNESHSLESACKAFGVKGKLPVAGHGRITKAYINYNRGDVLAAARLLVKLRAEFDRHPIDLLPSKALSPASIAKAYLRAMGIRPPAEKFAGFPKDKLAAATMGYFGGRAECRVRCVPAPVLYCDYLSMYPSVGGLMRLWELIVADSLEAAEATAAVRRFLDDVTPEDVFSQAMWPRLRFFALVEPNRDVLPLRARYGHANDSFNIGVNPVRSKTPLWCAGPDLVAAKLLTGRTPHVLSAFYVVPKGQQKGLKRTKIRGVVGVDPSKQDYPKALIEYRKSLGRRNLPPAEKARLDPLLKLHANAIAYGVAAEIHTEDLPANKKVDLEVFGLNGPFASQSGKPEEPGKFWFMPIAALTTGGARLMLARLERCVTDLGGSYLMADTDSLAITATENGGPIAGLPAAALSWQQVNSIVARFERLNPYNKNDIRDPILKIEKQNFENDDLKRPRRQLYGYAISAKRYALFNLDSDDGVILRKWSEHGLGHLLNPTDPDDESRDWIAQIWLYIIGKALGRNPAKPSWFDRPALSRITASSPDLVERLNQARRDVSYADSIKPFNFLLAPHVAPLGHPAGEDPGRFRLIGAYETDARKRLSSLWINRYTGKRHRITTGDRTDATVARIKSYADVVEEYETHPEPKSADQYGQPCSRTTKGLLYRREVEVDGVAYVGKESNQIQDVEAWLVHNWEEVQEVFHDPNAASLMAALKQLPAKELASKLGLTTRQIRNIKNGRSRPRKKTAKVLRGIIALVMKAKG